MLRLCALLVVFAHVLLPQGHATVKWDDQPDPKTPLEYFAIIKEQKDKTPRRFIEGLGKLKTDAAFGILKRSVDEMRGRWAKQYVFSAMRFFLEDGELAPKVIKFTHDAAMRKDAAAAQAATGAMLGWGQVTKEALYEVAEDGWDEQARSQAIRGVHALLIERKDDKALRTVLEAYRVPASGSADKGIALIQAFTAPKQFEALKKFVASSKAPMQRMLLVIDAMAAHPTGIDALLDEGVDAVLREGLEHRDYVMQYRALRAVAHRGATTNYRSIAKLLKSKDETVRRAAILASLRTQDPNRRIVRGPKHLDPMALAESEDSITRQAAAIGLADLGSPEALEALHLLTRDEDWMVGAEAIQSLMRIRDRSSIPVLIEGLAEAKGRLRGDFRTALVSLTALDLGQGAGSWRIFWSKESETFQVPTRKEVAKAAEERAERKQKGDSRAAFYGLDVVSEAFVLVVDTSGSMNAKADGKKTRLDVAKEQMSKTLQRVRNGVLFNVIPFSTSAQPLSDGMMPIDEERREEALAYVQVLRELGGTNIFDALSAAFEDERVDTVYLLSDGDPSAGEITDVMSLRAEIERWNSTRGILIHAIAVGQDHALLKGLAEDSGGKYVRVE